MMVYPRFAGLSITLILVVFVAARCFLCSIPVKVTSIKVLPSIARSFLKCRDNSFRRFRAIHFR